jgi:oligopeptide transport system ATP-binding protein
MTAQNQSLLLSINNLSLGIQNTDLCLVRDVSFDLIAGECLAIVGESGCGKSLTAMSLAGLLPEGIVIQNGTIQFLQKNLHALSESQWQTLRGNDIGVIFQNPLTAFNPTMRIGDQIAEVLVKHQSLSWPQARQQSIDLLQRMGVSSPTQRAKQYPFEFSGGMLQRAMIAMAVACKPRLLIADEPTTALDVTVQAQVLNLLRELQHEQGMALLLVTHDLAVVAEMAQHIAVMYAGSFVEVGSARDVLAQPQHPYTQALKSALPVFSQTTSSTQPDYIPLTSLAGTPPDPSQPIIGCALASRCTHAMKVCIKENPPWSGDAKNHNNRCWLAHSALQQVG